MYLRILPDLSLSPNIKELYLRYCENLVEVHDSNGYLDKLEVWNLDGCTKLRILPNCLMMNSLRSFILSNCSSLKKFPNISGEMRSLDLSALDGIGICKLPPSFGFSLDLRAYTLGNYLVPLPRSIYGLQYIKHLTLLDEL